jgi:predicted dehydrogenase
MAMTVPECDRMVDLARAKGVSLSVISQRRFEEQNRRIQTLVDQGAIGRLLLIEVSCPYYRTQEYYRSADWRGKIATDGGAIMNQGIHSVDLMLWFAGPARSVLGRCATQAHAMEAEDLALAIVEFQSGALGTIMASTSIQPGFQPCLNLYGEKGTIKLDGAAIAHWTVPGVSPPELGERKASAAVSDPKLASHLHHALQLEDALSAIDEGRPPRVTGEDGRRAVQLIQGLYEASRSGRPVAL